ncbi:MAG: phenylalanine--tRNA ligase subunit beta, partial [Sciscionella sp.]|nr:phenylalanine--tRNA ligase subunit beta [Sciscionella sp.]
MRISTSWLAKRLDLRTDAQTAARTREFVDAFVELGMEVEDVHELGVLDGPVVIGRVATIEVLTGFKKPIRFCQVEVGELSGDVEDEDAADDENLRGIICGATNFAEGDLVVVALPGAVLPGDFTITARKTYGRISDGMICSARELGIGDEHAGILVLPSGFAEPGTDAVDALKLRDSVIELEITPDRGYCLSVRGLARELAAALDLDYNDPAGPPPPKENADSWPVRVADSAGCPRFVARRITGVDVGAPTPWWMRRRLMSAGIRSISLVVDVTNYVMLELGQPLHAYDAGKLSGPITVRRANPGEKLTTLDDVQRVLDVDDLVICDDSGPIGLAGVMGGASTEIDERSTDIVLEGAHFDPRSIARAARRHKLPSEASRRFERFVDPALPPSAVDMAARLLGQLGDGNVEPGRTDVGGARRPVSIEMPIDLPDQVAGVRYARGATVRRLTQIGCHNELNVESGRPVIVSTPPTWRNDLAEPIDLVEEVLRLEGYDQIPSELPPAPPGRGLTRAQRRRRTVSRALAEAGYVEVLPFPFVDGSVFDAFGLADDDVRRNTVRVLNPLDADRAELATTLLPGMLETLQRNVSRGAKDVALFAIEQVFLPHAERRAVPALGVGARPSDAELAMMEAALPAQPVHVAVVLAGDRRRAGWWGAGE